MQKHKGFNTSGVHAPLEGCHDPRWVRDPEFW